MRHYGISSRALSEQWRPRTQPAWAVRPSTRPLPFGVHPAAGLRQVGISAGTSGQREAKPCLLRADPEIGRNHLAGFCLFRH